MADLHVNVAGVEFSNPLIAASGTFGFGREYAEFYPLSALGGVSSKGITLKSAPGNPAPRIAEAPGGMLNAVGLQNPASIISSARICRGFAGRARGSSRTSPATRRRITARWLKSSMTPTST